MSFKIDRDSNVVFFSESWFNADKNGSPVSIRITIYQSHRGFVALANIDKIDTEDYSQFKQTPPDSPFMKWWCLPQEAVNSALEDLENTFNILKK